MYMLCICRYDSGCLSGCLVLEDFQTMFSVGSVMNASIIVSVPLVASVFASVVCNGCVLWSILTHHHHCCCHRDLPICIPFAAIGTCCRLYWSKELLLCCHHREDHWLVDRDHSIQLCYLATGSHLGWCSYWVINKTCLKFLFAQCINLYSSVFSMLTPLC